MQPQPQQNDMTEKWKRNFRFGHALMFMIQRAITVPWRERQGMQSLRTPCALAMVLMFVWWMVSADRLMGAYLGTWVICFLWRRSETQRLIRQGERIHSDDDGRPAIALGFGRLFGCTEKTARLVVEPIIAVGLGGVLYSIYQDHGWSPAGLPYFFLAGGFALPFVELVRRAIWERRIEGMNDARIEQEAVMQEYRDRYGNS
jgi:hypothetical protein